MGNHTTGKKDDTQMSSKGGYHPRITSINQITLQIFTELFVNKNYESAIDQMSGLIALIKEEDYPAELLKTIEDEYESLLRIKGNRKLSDRKRLKKRTYKKWFRELNSWLWKKKYLENEKYEPFKLEEDDAKF